jgi:hypothetical protein
MKNNFGEEIPDKLYKYMPWRWVVDKTTGEKRNYAKELIENSQFYLSPIKDFNDPFDGSVYYKSDLDFLYKLLKVKIIKKSILTILKILGVKDVNILHVFIAMFEEIDKNNIKISWESFANNMFQHHNDFRKTARSTCFSKKMIIF